MGRVERRVYRRKLARRRCMRTVVLLVLIAVAVAAMLGQERRARLSAEAIAQPTATPIAVSYDQSLVEREVTLPEETWYAIQTGVFSTQEAAQEKAGVLTQRGAPGAVVQDGDKWRVFIACYGTETDAASVRQHLGENQRVETYLYRWRCPELQLRLKGMAGQVDVVEAGFTLMMQSVRLLRDTASLLDAGELTQLEAKQALSEQEKQVRLWEKTANDRFGRNPPSPVKELLNQLQAWTAALDACRQQETKTALSAQLKLEGIGLFESMVKLRATLGQ